MLHRRGKYAVIDISKPPSQICAKLVQRRALARGDGFILDCGQLFPQPLNLLLKLRSALMSAIGATAAALARFVRSIAASVLAERILVELPPETGDGGDGA